jgi:hypothetical protein
MFTRLIKKSIKNVKSTFKKSAEMSVDCNTYRLGAEEKRRKISKRCRGEWGYMKHGAK